MHSIGRLSRGKSVSLPAYPLPFELAALLGHRVRENATGTRCSHDKRCLTSSQCENIYDAFITYPLKTHCLLILTG